MVSDIRLVLKSEHHDLLVLADQCSRQSRGLHDPDAELRRRLRAHLAAADEVVYPLSTSTAQDLQHAVDLVSAVLADEAAARASLGQAARGLVDAEREVLLVLAAQLPLVERRRMGRVFRIRREAVLSRVQARTHRQRSQTELYELARRAGLENRSTMSQAQLQAAVAEWERRAGHGAGTGRQ